MTDPIVEVMARAIGRKDRALGGRPASLTSTQEAFAQAALQALSDAGYVVVPKEPTEAMKLAGAPWCDDIDQQKAAWGCYRDMIAAKP